MGKHCYSARWERGQETHSAYQLQLPNLHLMPPEAIALACTGSLCIALLSNATATYAHRRPMITQQWQE